MSGRILAVALVCMAGAFSARPAAGHVDTDAAIEAVRRNICDRVYWRGTIPPLPGQTYPVAIRKDGDLAHLWIEGMERWNYEARIASYFEVLAENGVTSVVRSGGLNIATKQGGSTSSGERAWCSTPRRKPRNS